MTENFPNTQRQQSVPMYCSMTILNSAACRFYGSILLVLVCSLFTMHTRAAHDLINGDDPQYQLGLKVYSDYCSRCHGAHADGRGRTTPLYVKMRGAQPSNFQLKLYSFRPKEYLANIVRDGGEKHSLSEYMPPFGGELTAGQIDSVVYFIQQVSVYVGKTSKHDSLQEIPQTQKEK